MSEESLNKVLLELDSAIEMLASNNYDKAKEHLNIGIQASDCSVCQLELNILKADAEHAEKMCMLGVDVCKEENEALIEKAKLLKADFEEAQKVEL